ncbi:UPF0225 protein [Spirochaetia bacterium]|nr:UPF0225 protein [Spirochaetia bacterium]
MKLCPCGSGHPYRECCEPYITGVVSPSTAEALMRARYSAYAEHAVTFIINTCTKTQDRIDEKETREWSEQSEWLGLEILSVQGGGIDDSEGVVEFKANFRRNGAADMHHERASFRKQHGKWLYDTGKMVIQTVTRDTPKIGRNDPCPCGSGKKYKHCCGR